MLELNIFRERPQMVSRGVIAISMPVASQILSLSKLNWASTDSLCGEPQAAFPNFQLN